MVQPSESSSLQTTGKVFSYHEKIWRRILAQVWTAIEFKDLFTCSNFHKLYLDILEKILIWPEFICLGIWENQFGIPETSKIQTKIMRAQSEACYKQQDHGISYTGLSKIQHIIFQQWERNIHRNTGSFILLAPQSLRLYIFLTDLTCPGQSIVLSDVAPLQIWVQNMNDQCQHQYQLFPTEKCWPLLSFKLSIHLSPRGWLSSGRCTQFSCCFKH